jgi:hypothetical protein
MLPYDAAVPFLKDLLAYICGNQCLKKWGFKHIHEKWAKVLDRILLGRCPEVPRSA